MYPYIYITLPSYAVLAVIGALAVAFFLYFRIEKYKLPFLDFIRMFALCIVFGFLGSRLVYVGSRLSWLLTHFSYPRYWGKSGSAASAPGSTRSINPAGIP